MEEKGGKGYSASKGKAAAKSVASKQGSMKGKENHVEIDSDSDSEGFTGEKLQSNSKSNGKASGKSPVIPTPTGLSGKGGKAGGKGSIPRSKPPRNDADLKLELDIPNGARILLDCEAAEILQDIHEHMALLSEDPKIKIPESFDKAFQYAKEGRNYADSKSLKQVLEPLKNCGLSDGEICMIANVGPESLEEVYALIPSLKVNRLKNEGPIKEALSNLANVKLPK